MRRTAAAVAALALAASGLALAAPAQAAAKPLKPGAPTAVKAVATAKGTVTVTWKAPAVKAKKTAKATSYSVACSGAKAVTVKATKATVTIVKGHGYKDNVICGVTALAGKLAGPAAKSAGVTAYYAVGAGVFKLTGDAATILGSKLGAKAPALFDKKNISIALPLVDMVDGTPDATLVFAGALIVAGVPVPQISIVPDAAYTDDVPVYDLVGKTSIGVIPVLKLTNLSVDQNTGITSFDVSLTDSTKVVGLLKALGINVPAGAPLGTGQIAFFG